MEFKSLAGEEAQRIHACFRDSFYDYVVKIDLPFEKYQRHILRYGVELKHSVGAYDEGKLVGFILNAAGIWNGRPTIYDAGTGMLPEFREKGYTKQMFEKVLDIIRNEEYEQYLLEVIKGNDAAFALYQKQGFTIQRELFCFKADKDKIEPKRSGAPLSPCTEMDWGRMQSFWDFSPSWQNGTAAVTRYREYLKCIGAYGESGLCGYAYYEPKTGDIPQFAVHPGRRRKGLASAMISYIKNNVDAGELRVLNVSDPGTKDFLLSAGFSPYVDQYEMMLELG